MIDNPKSRLARLATWQLSQAAARAHRVLHQRLANAGATGYDYRVLAALGDLGQASQADIGRLVSLDRRDVTITVRSLEARGHVVRCVDPSDARQRLVELTAAGGAALELLDALLERTQREVFAPLTDTERNTLRKLLQKLS